MQSKNNLSPNPMLGKHASSNKPSIGSSG